MAAGSSSTQHIITGVWVTKGADNIRKLRGLPGVSCVVHSGLSHILLEQTTHNTKWLKAKIKLTLTDQFKQHLQSTVQLLDSRGKRVLVLERDQISHYSENTFSLFKSSCFFVDQTN